jgi:alpha-tubulin suppressor-like RCC1 family protein
MVSSSSSSASSGTGGQGGGVSVVQIALGQNQSCARKSDGTVFCWGRNGGFHGCAAKTDGTVRCWGANKLGQIGDGTTRAAPRVSNPRASAPEAVSSARWSRVRVPRRRSRLHL